MGWRFFRRSFIRKLFRCGSLPRWLKESSDSVIVATTVEPATSSRSDLRDILRLAVPTMLALASQPLLSIGDTAMIGRLGVEPLAARAVGSAIIGAIYWIFAFLSFGTA